MFPRCLRNVRFTASLAISCLGLLLFISCGGEKAGAADENKVAETFSATPGTFRISAEDLPTVNVDGEATIYILNSSGTLSFRGSGGEANTFKLDSRDIVIERTLSGTVTFVRDVD